MSSSVTERPLADPLDPQHDALVGIRAGHERVLLEPVLRGEAAHFRRDERKHGVHGVETEVPSLWDTHTARLGDLEVVAHLEPADGASLDALHRDADVVQRHLGHAADITRSPGVENAANRERKGGAVTSLDERSLVTGAPSYRGRRDGRHDPVADEFTAFAPCLDVAAFARPNYKFMRATSSSHVTDKR